MPSPPSSETTTSSDPHPVLLLRPYLAPHAKGDVHPRDGTPLRRFTQGQRRHVRRGARESIDPQNERCKQEILHHSGVFVAFSGPFAFSGSDAEGEYDAVIRLSYVPAPAPSPTSAPCGKNTLTLALPSARDRDDGVPLLSAAQLTEACAFLKLALALAPADAGTPRVYIETPRERAVDGMSVAVCWVVSLALALGGPGEAGDRGEEDAEEGGAVHRLLMAMHDLPCPSFSAASAEERPADTAEDDEGPALRAEWRGLLSRDGMDFLERVVRGRVDADE